MLDLLTKNGMLTCKLIETLIKMNHKLRLYFRWGSNIQKSLPTVSWETNLFVTHETKYSLYSNYGKPNHTRTKWRTYVWSILNLKILEECFKKRIIVLKNNDVSNITGYIDSN